MKRIETVVWEPVPDKPNYVTKKGARKVREVFSELEAELKSAGLLPDEYFILDRDFADENMDCPEFCDVICYAQWGSNEGIYLEMDVVYLNEQDTTYVRKNFATGKTLAEDGKSYDRMQYIAGYIYKLFMGDRVTPLRYMIVGKQEQPLREQLHQRLLLEYDSYIRDIFVHKPLDPAENGAEVGIRSLVLHNVMKCELPEEKIQELLDSDNALELLTKICRHVLEPDSFEITDTICACASFASELQHREEIIEEENQKNQVLIYEKNEKLLCPGCMYPVADLAALKEIDIPVPKFCENCGHKLHY